MSARLPSSPLAETRHDRAQGCHCVACDRLEEDDLREDGDGLGVVRGVCFCMIINLVVLALAWGPVTRLLSN